MLVTGDNVRRKPTTAALSKCRRRSFSAFVAISVRSENPSLSAARKKVSSFLPVAISEQVLLKYILLLSQFGLFCDCVCTVLVWCAIQDDHLHGKPVNVRDFDSCQWNVRDFTKSQGSVSGGNLVREKWPKLFIVSCIFASILDFAEFVHFILVSDHALLHSYPHHWQ